MGTLVYNTPMGKLMQKLILVSNCHFFTSNPSGIMIEK